MSNHHRLLGLQIRDAHFAGRRIDRIHRPGDGLEGSRNHFLGLQAGSVLVLVAQRAHGVAGLQIRKRAGLGVGEFDRIRRIAPEIGAEASITMVFGSRPRVVMVISLLAAFSADTVPMTPRVLPLRPILLMLLGQIGLGHDDHGASRNGLGVFLERPASQSAIAHRHVGECDFGWPS